MLGTLAHDWRHLADLHTLVAGLDLTATTTTPGRSTKPGPRFPPGLTERLDATQVRTDLAAVDALAEHLAHLAVDALDVTAPETTPARLRLAAAHPDIADEHEQLDLADVTAELIRALAGHARRAVRRIRTDEACLDVACNGTYEARLGPDADDALTCSVCRARVPREQWERWRSRTEWITADHAARLLHVTPGNAVWSRAKRERWRRRGEGRAVRYHVDDVLARMSPATSSGGVVA